MSSRLLEIQTRIYNLLASWLPESNASGAEPAAPAQTILENQNRMYDLLAARFAQMPDEIADAVLQYLEDHPEALNQAAVEAILAGRLDGIEGDVSGLKSAIDSVESAVMFQKNTEYAPDQEYHTTTVLNTDGTVSAGSASAQTVLEANVSGADKFTLKCSAYGGNSGARYAFYTATTYSGCNALTLIDTVKTYSRDSLQDYTVPSNAKMLLVYMNRKYDFFSCTESETLIKGYSSIADEYDPDATYSVGDCRTHDGEMYICCADITTAEAWNSAHWVSSTVLKQINKLYAARGDFSELVKYQFGNLNTTTGEVITNQKYWLNTENIIYIAEQTKVEVTTGYEAYVYYFNADGTYANNYKNITGDTAEQYFYNIVPAGSYVKFVIRIANSTATLYTIDIPKFLDKLTFKSKYQKTLETIDKTAINVSNGMAARMFAKGASAKTFSLIPGIICAGQSNIAGVIPSSSMPSSITFPMQYIHYSPSNINNSFDSQIEEGRFSSTWGVDLPLYKALNDTGNTYYAIKLASTGTGIDLECASTQKWTPMYEKMADISNALLLNLDKKIRTLNANYANTYDIRALVWHQGETDSKYANNGNPYIPERYYENFKNVIAYIRGVVGNERLPVIYGTISHSSSSYDPVIEAAQWRIANEDPNTYCIDMSGAGLIDSFHFNPDAAMYFGYKAFDALIDFGVVTGSKINPSCPWDT